MKTRALIAPIMVMMVFSACEIVDPFLIALNLPLEVCGTINTGNSWNEDELYNIRDEIRRVSESYENKVKATRVNDISIYMPNPPAQGAGSGEVRYSLDGGTLLTLLTFTNVPFSSLAGGGISLGEALANPSGPVQFNSVNLLALLNALQNPNGLPATTTVRIVTTGSTSVTVPQDTKMCARISYQADVEI